MWIYWLRGDWLRRQYLEMLSQLKGVWGVRVGNYLIIWPLDILFILLVPVLILDDVLCIFVAIFVMVWHRFTDNSSQYWVRIIRQILGRKLVNRLHIYLLKLLSPSCYLLAPIHSSGFSIYNFANIVIFYMSTVYFYRELSPTSHCMHTIFWNISLKNDENILN